MNGEGLSTWRRCICSRRSGLGSVDDIEGPEDVVDGVGVAAGVGVVIVVVVVVAVSGATCVCCLLASSCWRISSINSLSCVVN